MVVLVECVTQQANENCIKAFSPRVVKEFTGFVAFFCCESTLSTNFLGQFRCCGRK